MTTKSALIYKKSLRLIIRPLDTHDYENWSQAYASLKPAKNEWDESAWDDSELTKMKFKALLKSQKNLRTQDSYYHFGVFQKDDGVLVGLVSLMDISRGIFQNAYLGYKIFNNYWGQGFAQEACLAALKIAFIDLKLHRVEAGIDPKNKKSIRVAKGIGLRKEGLSKKRLFVNKKWCDIVIYAATKEGFKK